MSDGDDVLIERALKKDLAALEQLLFLRYDWLVAEARRKIPRDLWDIVGPEDVVQDASIKIFTSFEKFTPESEGALFQWMRRITHNVAVDELRKLSTREANSGRVSEAGIEALAEDLELLELTASTVLRKKELMRAFTIALEKLEPEYRRTIELLYIEGKSTAEVAAELGKPEGAIRGYRQRAREKLKESIIRLSFYV